MVSEVAAYCCGGGLGKISRVNRVVVATYVMKRGEQRHRRLGGQRSSAALLMLKTMIMVLYYIVSGWLCLPSSGAMPIRVVKENGMTGTIYSNPSLDQFKEKRTPIPPPLSRLTIPYKNISL